MIFSITLNANEQRELNGTGRFFNLLSCSAGQVRIRAIDSDGREITSTLILNGDSIEFEHLVSKLYVQASEDASATLYFSQHKLVNNGVTVKAAGSIKSTVKRVAGVQKLNSVAAQNQKIIVRPESPVKIGGQGEQLFNVAQNEKLELELLGDIYAAKEPLFIEPTLNAQEVVFSESVLNWNANGKIYGTNKKIFLTWINTSYLNFNFVWRNGVAESFNSREIPFRAGSLGGAFLQGRFCWVDSVRDCIYLAGQVQISGLHYLAVCRTYDFEIYEPVSYIEISNLTAGLLTTNNTFNFCVSEDESVMTFSGRTTLAEELLICCDINRNRWDVQQWSDITFDTYMWLQPHRKGVGFNYIKKMGVSSNHDIYKKLPGVPLISIGAVNYESQPFLTHGVNGLLWMYNNTSNELRAINDAGETVFNLNIALASPGDGRYGFAFCDDYMAIVGEQKITMANLKSGQVVSRSYLKDPLAPVTNQNYVCGFMQDETGISLLSLKNGWVSSDTKYYIFEMPFNLTAGDLLPTKVEVLELF